jgi:hypothetical protein
MGTTLTGTTPQDTYDSLIKVTDNGPLSATGKFLSDGLGNDSVLALSTTAVGVSETSPLGKLHVKTADTSVSSVSAQGNLLVLEDTENGLSILSSTAGAGYILFGDSADNDVAGIIYDHSANAMIFNTNAAERLRINSAGNVGIGTSAPAGKLEVSLPLYTGEDTSSEQAIFGNGISSNGVRIGYNNTNNIGYINALKPGVAWSSLVIGGNSVRFTANGNERVRVTTDGLTFNGDTAAANALDDYEEGTWTMGVSFGNAAVDVTTSVNTGTYTKIGRQVAVNGYITLTSKGSSTGSARITGLPFTIANNDANYSAPSFWFNNVTFTNQFQGYGNKNNTTIDLSEITILGALSALTNADFANNSEVMISFTYFV